MDDTQVIQQLDLGINDIGDGNPRESAAVRDAGFRVWRGRASGAIAASQIVRADDEILRSIERLAFTDETIPPSGLAILRPALTDSVYRLSEARRILAPRERVEKQDGIVHRSVELAVGFVGKGKLIQCLVAA